VQVTYTTTGVFAAGATGGTPTNGTASSTLLVDGVTLTYTAGADTGDPGNLFFTGDLGTFALTGTPTTGNADFDSSTFTLTVHLTQPGSNTGAAIANITGQVSSTAGGATILKFSPDPLAITAGGTTTYFNIEDQVVVDPNKGPATFNATISVVPLPATANMGIALLVCLAGAGVWRKVKSSHAVA
jgi:hypothetical protein